MNRRRSLTLAAGGLLAGMTRAHAGESDPVMQFMTDHKAPGLSFAIAKDGKILKQRAVGFANLETQKKLTSHHRFRIASVSKPITASAIFLLIEQGKLTLDSPVFGKEGFLDGPGDYTASWGGSSKKSADSLTKNLCINTSWTSVEPEE